MTSNSINSITRTLCTLGLLLLSQSSRANESLSQTESFSSATMQEQPTESLAINLDLGWDSQYISQGRDNLEQGGLYWLNTSIQYGNLTTYVLVGHGDSQDYTEWNIGFDYCLNLTDNLTANLGYQRIESYGSDHGQDNEFFTELAYTATPWLVPSVSYVYSTAAAGYFIEVSLHSYWDITEQFTLTPYITQGFDFNYRTEAHDGRNNLQLGLEASYQLLPNMSVSGHISHSIAQEDIEQEAAISGDMSSQDQTYAGIYFSMAF